VNEAYVAQMASPTLPFPMPQSAVPLVSPIFALASLKGRIVELSALGGGASLSLAMQLTLDAQQSRELAAWVQIAPSGFFPPDAANAGIDLANLPVLFVNNHIAAARVAEHLLRSGAFALVVIDVSQSRDEDPLPIAMQSRLLGLAQKHTTAIVCLSEKNREAASIGSLVSLRVHSEKRQHGEAQFRVDCQVTKDKRSGPGARFARVFDGPPGVC
jgi:recombination protein RecA